MGQLLIRGAAAAVGFALGGPTGAQLGWGLGGFLVGSPDKVTRVQGPTLDDLRVFGTEYGQCIPWARGSICTAGQVWWNTDRIPTETTTTTTESGGKGGPGDQSTVTTVTTYHIDVLIGLVDHEIVGVRRIWDNGGLIYNAADDADPDTISSSRDTTNWDRLTVYRGTATQLPDPDYELAVGAPALAYRHRAYVFIKGLKLGQSGALRNLTFEVVIDGTLQEMGDWTLQHQEGFVVNGVTDDAAYGDGAVVMTGPGNTMVSPDNGETWTEYNRTGVGTGTGKTGAAVAWGVSETVGARFVDVEGGTGWDGNTQSAMWSTDGHTWTRSISGFNTIGYTSGGNWRIAFDDDGAQWVAVHSSNVSQVLGLFSCKRTSDGSTWTDVTGLPRNVGWHDIAIGDSAAVVVTSNTTVEGGGALTGQVIINLDDPGFLSWTYKTAAAVAGWNRVCYAGSNTFIATAPTGQMMRSADRGQTWAVVSGAPSRTWTAMDSNRDGAVVAVSRNSATTDNAYISTDFGLTWTAIPLPHACRMRTIVWGDGRFIASGNDDGGGEAGGTNSFFTLDFGSDLITRVPPSVQDVCERALEKTGLVNGTHFDCSALATITRPVYSLPVSQAGPMRATLDVIFACYFIECRIHGGKLQLIPRGGAPVKTIPYADLGAGLGKGNYNLQLPLDDANDIEISAQSYLMYRNYANDYQRGAEPGDRQITAVPGTVEEITVPIGFPPNEAKIVIDAMVMEKATSRVKIPVYLLGDHVELEPGDAYNAIDANGGTYRLRAVACEDTYPLLKFDSVIESAIVITSPGITDENYDEQVIVSGIAATDAEYLDIPMLTDADNNLGMYVGMRGSDTTKGWPGATLLGSDNDVDFSAMTALSSATRMGVCLTILGAPRTALSVFDDKNILRVNVGPGVVLSSSTRAAVLASKEVNAAVVGIGATQELIQFVNATPVSDGVFDISYLLRGRQGTEWATGSHIASERFVMLERGKLTRAAISNAQLGLTRYYKPVTFERDESTVDSETFIINGISRKPYAPVYLRATRDGSGNAVFTWEHRSRFSTRMYGDGGVNIPLGENTEQYVVEIYSSAAFTTVVRTVTVSAPTYAYSASDKTADGLTPSVTTPDFVRVYQVSDIVGRGYPLQGTV